MPPPGDALPRSVLEHRPVVLTGVFDGQEVAAVRTRQDALGAWGPIQLQFQEEYAGAEGTPAAGRLVSMSLNDYADLTRRDPSTRLCCTEYETPARVLAAFRVPPACLVTSPPEDEVFGLPKKYGDFDLATNTFIANAGNVAHLHFDGDQREVLLHQVYGRKRIVLFPPAAAIHLRTLDGPFTRPSLAGLFLERMAPADIEEILARAGGWQTVLEPGETLYIPVLMWHYVEYLDDAMSFNIRFGRGRIGRFLSLDHFHRDPYIQNVAWALAGPAGRVDTVIDEIKAGYVAPAPDTRAKVRSIRALFRDLGADLCPEACLDRICPPDREDEQVSRIVQSRDMAGGLKYADPAMIARTRPAGPVTARQLEVIRDRIRARGYPPEVVRAVVRNRTGKADLAELTKAEGAQLIDYLSTPGAAW